MIKSIKIKKIGSIMLVGILPMDSSASSRAEEKTNLDKKSFKTCRSKEELFQNQDERKYCISYPLDKDSSESSLSYSNSDNSQKIFKSSTQTDFLENLTQEVDFFEPLTQKPHSPGRESSSQEIDFFEPLTQKPHSPRRKSSSQEIDFFKPLTQEFLSLKRKSSSQEVDSSKPLTQEFPSHKRKFVSQKRPLEKTTDVLSSPLHKRKKLDSEQTTQDYSKLIDEIFPSGSLSLSQSNSQEILTPELVESLENIKDNYDVFLVDIVGVIHDGEQAFKNSIHACNTLFEEGKIVALVTNTPRPYTYPRKTLLKMGLNPDIKIFTAGDVVREDLIKNYQGKKIYHLGAERNPHILENLKVQTTLNLKEADVVLLTQYIDPDESLEQFDSLLQEIVERKLLVLCANSDKTAPTAQGIRYCAGTLAEKIEKLKGIVKYYGKPYPEILEFIEKKIPAIQSSSKDRILFIGDTLEKDIKGAHNHQIKSMLVLTGTTAREIEQSSQEEKRALKHLCKVNKARPDHFSQKIIYSKDE